MLWRTPADSFFPHVVVDTSTSEWIAITMQDLYNVNQAPHLFNLCSSPSALYRQVEEVYDFYDETHAQKIELSKQRLQFYQSQGFLTRLEENDT